MIDKVCIFENISLSSSSIRRISSNSTNTTNHQAFTVSYLINSCGLSPKSALAASKDVQFDAQHKPDVVLGFLKNRGFSKAQIFNIVKGYPGVLLTNPDKTLLPKLEFLQSKGVSSPDIAKIISSHPWTLQRRHCFVPIFYFFKNLLQSDDTTIKVFKRYPGLLGLDLEIVTSMLDILRDTGVPESNLPMLARCYPLTMMLTVEKFKKHVEELRAMDFDTSTSRFILAMNVLCLTSRVKWERKLDAYRDWDYEMMCLFVNKLGWEPSFIAKHPSLMLYSVEKTLIPRASVLEFLVSRGLIEKSFRSYEFFQSPENKFLQNVISICAYSTELLQLYREKQNLSRCKGI
ncbi:transcription termination factor MTERF6 [Salix suchowensis]|nr:transcription termination factor MTERF6 [Salix suchowensis]